MLKLAGGAFYYSRLDYVGEGAFSIGLARQRTAWDVSFQRGYGRVIHGLEFRSFDVGYSYEWILGGSERVRLGIGPSFGVTTIVRVTHPSETIQLGTPDLRAHVSVDLVRVAGRSGLYLAAVLGFQGPLLVLGLRFEGRPSRGAGE